jgi:predicted metal-dependent hydrolase
VETPFQWNPANPEFGIAMNGLSFVAPPFERYLVTATRMAMDEITNPAVRDEADAFLRQEATHARAHRQHVAALVARYPGLGVVLEAVDVRFDRLLQTRLLAGTRRGITAGVVVRPGGRGTRHGLGARCGLE